LTALPHFRFAVGSFDSWLQLRAALDDLSSRGLAVDSISCLALERVFTGRMTIALFPDAASIAELPFSGGNEPVCCTAGPLRDFLLDRFRSGARSFKEVIGHRMVPRHAAYLQETVEQGKIQLWIRLANADDERRACQSLLANSSNSVSVHDLAAPTAVAGNGSLRP
jgi:hypothetical protein